MLLLTSSSDLVKVNTSASTDIEVHASWADNVSGTITPGRTNTASITGTGDTTVVAGPSSGQRNVTHLNIRNNHGSTTCNVLVSHSDGSTVETLAYAALLAGEALVFDATGMWTHYDASGNPYPRGGMSVATQAQQETASSIENLVVPGRQQFHPSACKFWGWINGTGVYTSAINEVAPYNITSITDTGAGLMTVNIGTDFSSADWVCCAAPTKNNTTLSLTNLKFLNVRNATQAAGSVTIECMDFSATPVQEDPTGYAVFGFGDQ